MLFNRLLNSVSAKCAKAISDVDFYEQLFWLHVVQEAPGGKNCCFSATRDSTSATGWQLPDALLSGFCFSD